MKKFTLKKHLAVALTLLAAWTAQGQVSYQTIKSFGVPGLAGAGPTALIEGSDGALYGTTQRGGSNDVGTVFRLNKDGSGRTTLCSFTTNGVDGRYPRAALVEGSDGALYGTTSSGGSNDVGAVFKLNKDGSGGTTLCSFTTNGLDGRHPAAALVEGSDGVLYGTTQFGGTSNVVCEFGCGTVFRVNKDGTARETLHHFTGSLDDGANPLAELIEGSDGALYGTTAYRGPVNQGLDHGIVFKLNKDGSGYSLLHSFAVGEGQNPYAGLIEGSDGVLYGTTASGVSTSTDVGTVFKLNNDGGGYKLLHSFTNVSTDGESPQTSLIEGSDGALYGTTSQGGSAGGGTVFKLHKDGRGFVVLYTASGFVWCAEPPDPPYCGGYGTGLSRLVEGNDGALYGATFLGGLGGCPDGCGTVFKLNGDGSGHSVLLDFTDVSVRVDEAHPMAGLIEGRGGPLYGTTLSGGSADGAGTIFRLNLDGSGYGVLHSFSGTNGDGVIPSRLVQGNEGSGSLYGTTSRGGSADGGTVFKLHQDGSGYALLHSFSKTNGDGYSPRAGLIEGSDGALYGTAAVGGIGDLGGTVFKLNKDGSNYAVLHSFDAASGDGQSPLACLVEGSDGALYGTTYGGGNGACFENTGGCGTVFKLSKDGSDYTVLHNFDFSGGDGYWPLAPLVEGSDGVLYGTTSHGGSLGRGTVFKLDKDGRNYALLHSFGTTLGWEPFAGLVDGSDGALYGTTYHGGSLGGGTAFKLNKDGSGYAVLHSFEFIPCPWWPPFGCFDTSPSELVEGSDGALYAATARGGKWGFGTVFRLQPTPEVSLALTPGGPRLRFAGQRGRTYEIQRAPALTGPWDTIATRIAPPDNLIAYTDTAAPPPAGFYRVRRVP